MTKMKSIGRNWMSPPPGCRGAVCSKSIIVTIISAGSYPSHVSRFGERHRLLPRRRTPAGRIRALPELEKVLSEDAAHLFFGVPAPQELFGQGRQLRNVFETVRRILDPVVVRSEPDRPGPRDLHHVLDVVDDRGPARSRPLQVLEQGRGLRVPLLRVVRMALRDLRGLRSERCLARHEVV